MYCAMVGAGGGCGPGPDDRVPGAGLRQAYADLAEATAAGGAILGIGESGETSSRIEEIQAHRCTRLGRCGPGDTGAQALRAALHRKILIDECTLDPNGIIEDIGIAQRIEDTGIGGGKEWGGQGLQARRYQLPPGTHVGDGEGEGLRRFGSAVAWKELVSESSRDATLGLGTATSSR